MGLEFNPFIQLNLSSMSTCVIFVSIRDLTANFCLELLRDYRIVLQHLLYYRSALHCKAKQDPYRT